MDWTSTRAEYTEQGQTMTVARPALVMELYADGPKMVGHGEELLDAFITELPKGTELYVLGNNDREYKKVSPQSLRRVRSTLAELDKSPRFYSIKDAPGFDVGQHSLEFKIGTKHATVCDTIQLAWPVEWGDASNAAHTIGFFRRLIETLPVWGGAVGYGFDIVWGREFEQRAMPVAFAAAQRFKGLLLRERIQESYLIKKLKSAGWLTYLGQDLLSQIGGAESLAGSLPADVTVSPVSNGVLVQTGVAPSAGDVNRQDPALEALGAVNRAIKNVRIDKWRMAGAFFSDPDSANEWLHRFD